MNSMKITLSAVIAAVFLAASLGAQAGPAKPASKNPGNTPAASSKAQAAAKAGFKQEIELAVKAYQAEDYREAATHLRKVVELSPSDAEAWSFLGRSLAKSGDTDGAGSALMQVLKLQPDSAISGRTIEIMNRLKVYLRDCPECPEMALIPAGSFDMGSNSSEDEKPVHRVSVKSFAIGKTEVTQGQWKAVMGNNPSYFSNCGDDCPVEQVSWNDAQEFIQKLNSKTGKQYRLPSEAEWEYACHGGKEQKYCGSDNLDGVGWYGNMGEPGGNSGQSVHSVGTLAANAFGLYDMSGNVWEWVEDSYHDSYNGAPSNGTAWSGDGAKRVLRGGSWNIIPLIVRAASRVRLDPAFRASHLGFRLARTLP